MQGAGALTPMAVDDAAPPVAPTPARAAASHRGDTCNDVAWLAIYNPTAGRTRRSRAWSRVASELRRAGLHIDVATTQGAGDAADIAARAMREGCQRIMVAGGDGTVHEVVNGLMRGDAARTADGRPTLVPLPLGTGNDWARSLRLPHEPAALARCVRRGRTLLHDVGRITFPGAARCRALVHQCRRRRV